MQAERVAKLSDVTRHEKELQDIQNQLEQYAESDPDKVKALSRCCLASLKCYPPCICCSSLLANCQKTNTLSCTVTMAGFSVTPCYLVHQ